MKTKSLLTFTGFALMLSGMALADEDQWGYRILDFDVATDARTLAVTGLVDRHSESGEAIEMQARGSNFLINGTFFAKGTIKKGDYGFDPDTAPKPLGTWISAGVYNVNIDEMNGDVPHATSTTQLVFSASGDQAAPNSLTVVGQEGGMITWRPITGGTGKYRGAVGQMSQKYLGKNSTGGVNLRVRFRIKDDIESLNVNESVETSTTTSPIEHNTWNSDIASGSAVVAVPIEMGISLGLVKASEVQADDPLGQPVAVLIDGTTESVIGFVRRDANLSIDPAKPADGAAEPLGVEFDLWD